MRAVACDSAGERVFATLSTSLVCSKETVAITIAYGNTRR